MFRFANIEYLYLLFLLPLFIALYLVMRKMQQKATYRFVNSVFSDLLMPLRSPFRSHVKFIFFLIIFSLLVVAVSRPQFGSKLETVKREGIELIIALDVSRSMLAEDIKPNRLERAKQAVTTLINRMRNDKIGIIVFAGDAYTQLPITTDYISAKIFLANINTEIVSKQGTAITSAIELASRSFTQDVEASKVIVIISDGEDHEGDAIGAAKNAAQKGINIFTVGMGSPTGAPIPLSRTGGSQSGFLRDSKGEVVISRLDPAMLSKIAAAGNGEFYSASTGNVGLNQLYNELKRLNTSEIETQTYSEYDDQFHYLIALALLLLFIDVFILERRSKLFRNFSLFGKK